MISRFGRRSVRRRVVRPRRVRYVHDESSYSSSDDERDDYMRNDGNVIQKCVMVPIYGYPPGMPNQGMMPNQGIEPWGWPRMKSASETSGSKIESFDPFTVSHSRDCNCECAPKTDCKCQCPECMMAHGIHCDCSCSVDLAINPSDKSSVLEEPCCDQPQHVSPSPIIRADDPRISVLQAQSTELRNQLARLDKRLTKMKPTVEKLKQSYM
jgi:hypothetical protein